MQTNETEPHYDKTVKMVRTALPRMSEHRIPITPTNHAVWFEYLAEKNAALQTGMDELLAQGKPITGEKMRELYERYISQQGDQLEVAKGALAQLVQTLLYQLSEADESFSKFSTTLSDIADKLSTDTTIGDLTVLIERALAATSAALEQGVTIKGQLFSLANEMQGLREELKLSQEKARVDPLTGLQNRLAFREEIEKLSQEGFGDAHTPCLLMVDVDHFKRVNDTYGHIAGDAILQEVGREISRNVRGKDMVARYGGEEFAVLLRDTPRSGCHIEAENIRAGLETCRIDLPAELSTKESVSVTVSIGGGWFREGESFESSIDRADRALYLSKQGGRNRVTWESHSTETK